MKKDGAKAISLPDLPISPGLPRASGNAYVYVLFTGLLLFMLIGAALLITGQSRRVSAAYPAYAGLYDMAVAGNERAVLLMQNTLRDQYPSLDAAVRTQLFDDTLADHLAYKDGTFHLHSPTDGYYEKLYKIAAKTAIKQFLRDMTGRTISPWKWEQTLSVTYPALAVSGDETGGGSGGTGGGSSDAGGGSGAGSGDGGGGTGGDEPAGYEESYLLITEVDEQGDWFKVTTTVYKTVNGVTGFPTMVEALIDWYSTPHEELYLPTFAWRDGPPLYFTDCLFPSVTPDTAFDSTRLSALTAHHEQALLVTDEPMLDVSTLYDGDTPNPVFVVHTGGGPSGPGSPVSPSAPLRIYASDASKNRLTGIVCSFGEVTLEDIHLTGTVIAAGAIHPVGSYALTLDDDMLFTIPLTFAAQQDVLDFLKLTRFSQQSGVVTDLQQLLGAVTFDFSSGSIDDIVINYFDAASLAMVKSKKITE